MERSGTHDHASSTSQSFTAPFRLASRTRSRALSPTLLALPHLLLTVAVAILCSSLANASWDGINEFTVVTASTGAATTTERTVSVTGTGSCQCKLLSSACVVNCYCDSNCSSTTLFDTAYASGGTGPTLQYCASDAIVYSVSLPENSGLGTVTQATAGNDFVSQSLCIVSTNNPALGLFFLDPAEPATNELVTRLAATSYAFSTAQSTFNPTSSTTYKAFDPIPVADSSVTSSINNAWTIPAALYGGACSRKGVGFGIPWPPVVDGGRLQFPNGTECVQNIVTLSTECAAYGNQKHLDIDANLITNMRLKSTIGGTTFDITPTISASYTVNLTTGAETSAGTVPLTPTYAAPTCSNVVIGVEYTVTYSLSAKTISAVSAVIYYADVVANAAGGYDNTRWTRVRWQQTNETNQSLLSGNPGYLTGYPVLAGVLNQSGDAKVVNRFVNGLPMPMANPSGLCSTNAAQAATFRLNASYGCYHSLTVANLQAACTSSAVPAILTYSNGLFGVAGGGLTYSGNTVYLGAWGDASQNNITDWVQVTTDAYPTTATWNAATLTCSDVAVGYNIQVLVAKIGSSSNPQYQIQEARLTWKTGTWRFQDGVNANTGSTTDGYFTVQSSITFVARDQGLSTQVAAASPPLLPAFPSDVLYPFYSGRAVGMGVSMVLGGVVGVALLGLAW